MSGAKLFFDFFQKKNILNGNDFKKSQNSILPLTKSLAHFDLSIF